MTSNSAIGVRLLFVWAAMALAACSVAPPARDAETLKPNQGLVAFYVVSNADSFLTYGNYASESTFGSRFSEEMIGPKGTLRIKSGKTYQVVPMDPGEYMFSKFSVYPRFAWLQSTNKFTVAANSITYIGHIQVNVTEKGFGLQARDQELDMRTYLADTYPVYFKSMNVTKSVVQLHLR